MRSKFRAAPIIFPINNLFKKTVNLCCCPSLIAVIHLNQPFLFIRLLEGLKMKKLIAALIAGLFAAASFAADQASAPAASAPAAAAPAASAAAPAPKAKKVKKAKKAKKAAAPAAASAEASK